jgi:hypothetical protein
MPMRTEMFGVFYTRLSKRMRVFSIHVLCFLSWVE